MARFKIRYLVTKPGRRGTTRYFWQPSTALRKAGWFPRRLAENTGREADAIAEAEELNAAVDAWRAGEGIPDKSTPAPPGSMGELIRVYTMAPEFTELKPKTKRRYLQNIKVIEAWAGDIPVAAITPKTIKMFYNELKTATPGKAAQVVGMLRILFSFAKSENLAETNPAKDVTVKHGRKNKKESDIWSPEAIAAFVAAADAEGYPSIGTAVLLNSWIGQRLGDVLDLPANAYKDGAIQYVQSKTGAEVFLPVDLAPALKLRLEQERRRQKAANVTATSLLVCEPTGKSWKEEHFRKIFNRIRAHAAADCPACADVVFMRLRHTAITRLGEAEVIDTDIAAITGHSLQTIKTVLEHYLVRTKKMATRAFTKRLAAEKKNK